MNACKCISELLMHESRRFRKVVRRADRKHFDEDFKKNVKCAWYLDEILEGEGKKWDYLFVVEFGEKSFAVFVEIHKVNTDVYKKYSSIEHLLKPVQECVDNVSVFLSPTGQFKSKKLSTIGIKIKRQVTLRDLET